jgi:tetratricopeptide (TPR) repeat protein
MRLLNSLAALVVAAVIMPAVSLAQMPTEAEQAQERARVDRLTAPARALLEIGKYAEAVAAYGNHGEAAQRHFFARIAQADKVGDTEAALAACRAFLDNYPFAQYIGVTWNGLYDKIWDDVAFDYARRLGEKSKDRNHAQVRAAATYRKLIAAMATRDGLLSGTANTKQLDPLDAEIRNNLGFVRRDEEKVDDEKVPAQTEICEELVREMIKKHAQTIFCPAAIVLGRRLLDEGAPTTDYYKKCITALVARDAPARTRIMLLVKLAQDASAFSEPRAKWSEALRAYREAVGLTKIPCEKVDFLMAWSRIAEGVQPIEPLAERRAVYLSIVTNYPAIRGVSRARQQLIGTYLDERKLDQAEKVFRSLEAKAAPNSGLDEALFDIAQAHHETGDRAKAMTLCREVATRFPGTAGASLANLTIADHHEKLGEEKKMIAALERAAKSPPADTRLGLMDASNTVNWAHQRLAEYHMQHENWLVALGWWQKWEPTSWCANCADGMKWRKRDNTLTCKIQLGRLGEITGMLCKKEHISDEVVRTLVRAYRKQGQLDQLQSRLDAAIVERGRQRKEALREPAPKDGDELKRDDNPFGSDGPEAPDVLADLPELESAETAMRFIEMTRLAEGRDFAGLWKMVELIEPDDDKAIREYYFPAEAAMAKELLMSIPEKSKPFLLKHATGSDIKQRWALRILAEMKEPKVFPIALKKLGEKTTEGAVEDYFRALLLLETDTATEIVRRHSNEKREPHRTVARELLEYQSAGIAP